MNLMFTVTRKLQNFHSLLVSRIYVNKFPSRLVTCSLYTQAEWFPHYSKKNCQKKSGQNMYLHTTNAGSTREDLIFQETVESTHHITPELRLRLITPDCRLWMATPEESPFPEPFWGFYWPGGQALTRFILDSPSLVVKQRVLDFGCGCGASGLAAKIMKAKSVTFNDIDKDAMIAVHLNGSLNNIVVDKFASENLIGSSCEDYDVILVGDMLYDSEFADSLFVWLKELHQRGKKIYIGDPGRYAIAEHPLCHELRCLAKYQLLRSTVLENKGHSQSYVWTFS